MGLIMVSSRVRSLLLFLGVNLPGVGWAVFLVLVGRLPRLEGDLLLGVVNGGEVGVIGLVLGWFVAQSFVLLGVALWVTARDVIREVGPGVRRRWFSVWGFVGDVLGVSVVSKR